METLKKYYRFLIVFVFLLFSLLLLEQTKTTVQKDDYLLMADAANRAAAAFQALKEEKLARGYSISPVDDPNQTGMIGESYTEITTTLGSLESKRSAANPNNAAMVVDMLRQCGVKEGDTVAVNFSGSFPGLNTAVLCALDAVGANGIVISSVGASTYGANLPDFTWPDMEQVLLEKGLIQNHSQWFSMGGSGDMGKEMPSEQKEAIVSRLTGCGLTFLSYEDLDENLAARRKIYESGQGTGHTPEGTPEEAERSASVVCFINAGGNLLSFGGGAEMLSAGNGILKPGTKETASADKGSGLIPMFLREGVPVIHLLNLKALLPEYGIPFDPSPMQPAGVGNVYYTEQYNVPLACLLTVLSLLLFFRAVRHHPKKRVPL